MFQSQVPLFLTKAPDLYTSAAFDVPPSEVAPRPPEPDWVFYAGPNNTDSLEYKRFRASSSFRLAHQQWLDRLEDCANFARLNCTPAECSTILEGLRVFQARLLAGDGENYFGDRMALLFGDGKRAMDHLCQRLQQDELPLQFRCTALRHLADDLHLCLSTGPAFIQTATALDQAVGGLRTEFLAVVKQRSDAVLQAGFRRHFPDSPWAASMEVHGVNRMRFLFGLPGADPSDIHTLNESLDQAKMARHTFEKLRTSIHPAEVAIELGERFLARLQSRLPPDLRSMAPELDLNDHLPTVRAVMDELSVGFAPVSLHSLLLEDEETGEFHWRADHSLLALDLLQAMVAEGIAQPQRPEVLVAGRDAECEWRLERVGSQLFYATESSPPGAAAVHVPVACEHVEAWVSAHGRCIKALPAALVLTLVKSERPERLHGVRPNWLFNDELVRAWLSRLGPEGFDRWLACTSHAPECVLRRLLPALTDLGMVQALHRLNDAASLSVSRWLHLAGRDIFAVALRQPCAETLSFWQGIVRQGLSWMPRPAALGLLVPPKGPNLLSLALATGRAEAVRSVGELLSQGVELGVLRMPVSLNHLDSPVQDAMRNGHIDALNELREFLLKAARCRWMDKLTRQAAMEGSTVSLGCTGALEGGHEACVTWFFDLVETLADEKLLDAEQVEGMLCNHLTGGPMAGSFAIANNHPGALHTYFQRLIGATEKGLISPGQLGRLLSCMGREGAGLKVLLSRHPRSPALYVWGEAVAQVEEQHLIAPQMVQALLSGYAALHPHPLGPPLFWSLIESRASHEALGAWVSVVSRLHQSDALDSKQVELLLRASFQQERRLLRPVLFMAMATWNSGAMVADCAKVYSRAHREGLISKEQLEALLSAANAKGGTPALNAAVQHGYEWVVIDYFDALIRLAEWKQLPPAALLRLMDGRSDAGQSALHTAVRYRCMPLLKRLFAGLFQATQKRLIGPAEWTELLVPKEGTDSVVRLIGRLQLRQAAEIVRNAVITANGLKMLSADQASTLIRNLDTVRPEPLFPALS